MAHKDKHNSGLPIVTAVKGSSGATYMIGTDDRGVIACSCPAWLFKKKEPIEDRVCKHLEAALTMKPTFGKTFVRPPAGRVVGTRRDDEGRPLTPKKSEPAPPTRPGRVVRKLNLED